MNNKFLLGDTIEEKYNLLIEKIAKLLDRINVTPNLITILGLLFAVASAILFHFTHLIIGGILVCVAGIFDSIDGCLARLKDQETKFGAFLDSILDRYSEFFLYLGLWSYLRHTHTVLALLFEIIVLLTIVGSFMTSYTKTRAEGLNINCKIVFLHRPERFAFLGLATIITGVLNPMTATISYYLLNDILLKCVLLFLAVGTNYSSIQRFLQVRKTIIENNKNRYYIDKIQK